MPAIRAARVWRVWDGELRDSAMLPTVLRNLGTLYGTMKQGEAIGNTRLDILYGPRCMNP